MSARWSRAKAYFNNEANYIYSMYVYPKDVTISALGAHIHLVGQLVRLTRAEQPEFERLNCPQSAVIFHTFARSV